MPVGTLGKELDKRGWKYHAVDYTFWSEAQPPTDPEIIRKVSLKNTSAVVEIENIINKTKPDLVFTNSVVCPWAAIAANNTLTPHVWFVREYGDLDHGRIFAQGRKKTLEDVGVLSDLVIANSKALAAHLSKYIDSKKVATLYHPFNLKEIRSKASQKVTNPYKYRDSLKLILAAGSLTGSKGISEAVEAVIRLNKNGFNCEICLVGRQDNKEYLDEINQKITEQKIKDRVHFVGWQKNPLAYMKLADVGIMSSRQEAFGRVTFEYLAIGKPVLGTNSGGTTELVVDGQNGFLYRWGDVDSLAAGLSHYAKNKELIAKHSKKAAEHAVDMLSSEYNPEILFEKIRKVSKKN